MEEILERRKEVHVIAKEVLEAKDLFMIGRGMDYSILLEGSLKLKEVSYIHSEAYAAGELKHGPIALVEQGVMVTAILTQPKTTDKTIGNLQEVKARGAYVIVVCTESIAEKAADLADDLLVIPDTNPWTAPLLAVVPLQMLAYYTALRLGNDIDQPRNLAKSVSVE